jgi:hypothetical protein
MPSTMAQLAPGGLHVGEEDLTIGERLHLHA